MTTEELERDLQTLAEPQADDERLRLAIRATLGEQLQERPGIRRRTRLALGSGAVAAATLAAVAVVTIGPGGSGPASANAAILAHVARVLSPTANIIVHVRETGAQNDGTVAAEWWQETNPPYAMRLIKETSGQQVDSKGNAGGGQVETAADGTTSYQYDAGTNTIYQHPDSTPPTLIDPIETIRAALANGTAHVAGTVTIDGQSLYKIKLPNGVVGYFDRTDFRPLYLDNPQRDGSVVRTRVITYEQLPITPENEMFLSITAQHPRASVKTGTPSIPAKQK